MFAIIALVAVGFLGPFQSESQPANSVNIQVRSVSGIIRDHCKSTRLRRVQALLTKIAASIPLEKFHCICRGLTHAEAVSDARQFQSGVSGVPTENRYLGGEDILLARPYRFADQWPTRGDPRTTEILAWAVDEGKNRVLTEFFLGHPGIGRGSPVIFDGYLIPNDVLELANGSCRF